MEIIGTCLNCFPSSGSFLVNGVVALSVLGFALYRGGLRATVRG